MTGVTRIVYSSGDTPDWYICAHCGAGGVKLWRPHLSLKQNLLCAECVTKDQFKSISYMDLDGKWVSDFGLTDQIGNYVPAIPFETKLGYCVYSSAPKEDLSWWSGLPNSK